MEILPVMRQRGQVSDSFTAKKNTILTSLSIPESIYTDLSPKGSVDSAIKPLIHRINALEGVVTTSSCAGRVSVFLEGRKRGKGREGRGGPKNDEGLGRESGRAAVPGGKGFGGKWLFVSHEPVELPKEGKEKEPLTQLLGLGSSRVQNEALAFSGDVNKMRLVRFQFEPMILHIMTASLHHAQPILAAAINTGFRESGVQSLKNLEDPNAFPMVAIRTSGLAFESLIGVIPNLEGGGDEIGERITVTASETYLGLLLGIANERFKVNAERTQRFEEALFKKLGCIETAWEDETSRQERKRAEGLAQQQMQAKTKENQLESGQSLASKTDEDIGNGLFGSSFLP